MSKSVSDLYEKIDDDFFCSSNDTLNRCIVLFAIMQSNMHGRSVARPLYNLSPNDKEARDVDTQFTWGDGIMIAPVLTEGATEREVHFTRVRRHFWCSTYRFCEIKES